MDTGALWMLNSPRSFFLWDSQTLAGVSRSLYFSDVGCRNAAVKLPQVGSICYVIEVRFVEISMLSKLFLRFNDCSHGRLTSDCKFFVVSVFTAAFLLMIRQMCYCVLKSYHFFMSISLIMLDMQTHWADCWRNSLWIWSGEFDRYNDSSCWAAIFYWCCCCCWSHCESGSSSNPLFLKSIVFEVIVYSNSTELKMAFAGGMGSLLGLLYSINYAEMRQ